MLHQIDLYLFRLINNLAGKNDILDWFFYFCAVYLIFIMGFLALMLFFYYLKRETNKFWVKLLSFFIKIFKLKGVKRLKWEIGLKKKAYSFLFVLITATVFAWILKSIINLIYFRPRPYVLMDIHQLLFKSPLDASFPSGHTIVAFALAFAVFFKNKVWGLIFLVPAVLVGFGRIFVGVHYPLDIIAGIIIAFFSVLIAKLIIKRHFRYGK